MSKIQYLTPEGYKKLKEELEYLKTKARAEISQQIKEAREKGDLSENAEYDAAKEAQGMLEMKIAKLEETLSYARVLDDSKIDTSKVQILTTVRVKNLKMDREFTFTLVSESEANTREGKISVSSPIGKGLLGKRVGEIVEIKTPGGLVKFEILEVTRM